MVWRRQRAPWSWTSLSTTWQVALRDTGGAVATPDFCPHKSIWGSAPRGQQSVSVLKDSWAWGQQTDGVGAGVLRLDSTPGLDMEAAWLACLCLPTERTLSVWAPLGLVATVCPSPVPRPGPSLPTSVSSMSWALRVTSLLPVPVSLTGPTPGAGRPEA